MGLGVAAAQIPTLLRPPGPVPPSIRRSPSYPARPPRDSHSYPSANLGFPPRRPSPIPKALPQDAYPSSPASPVGTCMTSSPRTVGQNDLLIFGPGVLGRMVADNWRKDYLDCQIIGQTMTTDHHDELIEIGIVPSVSGTKLANKFPYVIFCAPPSRTADYTSDVRLAASNWSGEGCFLFTSSSGVYDCHDNGLCNEESPVVPIGRTSRIDVLLQTENAVLEVGGCVLRLAGLYKEDRGPHTYWLRKRTVASRPDHIVNLIHYEDAALLSIAIMKKKFTHRIFVGCDNHPLSRQEIMDCVNQSGRSNEKFLGFTGVDDPLGKKLNNSRTRAEVGWEPKYASFQQFLGLTD